MQKNPPFRAAELDAAIGLARGAGRLILELARAGIVQSRKSDRTLVTNADHASDRFICDGLLEAFPGDRVLSEERGFLGTATSARVWVVDPIDGTKAYARRREGFCVMIGLLEDDRPTVGVVYDPMERRLMFATAGGGAFVQGDDDPEPTPARVSGRSDPTGMRLVTSASLREHDLDTLLERTGLQRGPSVHSAGIKMGIVARGECDVYFSHHGLSTWDTVAPGLVLREAGGELTSLDGAPLTYDLSRPLAEQRHDDPVLASNGTCHEALLGLFRPWAC